MNFSAEKASRKWSCGSLSPQRGGNGYRCGAADALRPADPAAAATRAGAWPQGPWSGLFGETQAEEAAPGACWRCRCPRRDRPRRPSPTAGGEQAKPRTGGPTSRARTPRREPTRRPSRPRRATAALGLPAGADRCDRDRAQHPRHQGPRRLRRRGSGAAGGRGAAGQAAGSGEAGGDPPLHRWRRRIADWIRTDMAPLAQRLGSTDQRPRQFRLVRMPRPQPRGRRQDVRARPRQCARYSRHQARQRPVDLADRSHGGARDARERAAFGVRAVSDGAGAGLGLVSRGPHPSRFDGAAKQLPICQWDVWDPMPQIAPLLPAERPEDAPPREVAPNREGKSRGSREGKPSKASPSRPNRAGVGSSCRQTAQPADARQQKKRRQDRRF